MGGLQRRKEAIRFEPGDTIIDSRCGVAVTGNVTTVRGNSVYYTDGCSACRDGRHHRTQADFSTTSKGEVR
jgi:hypothetical protein